MPRKKVTQSFYLEAEQVERLRRVSQATGVPMAEICRQGVDAALAAREAPDFPEQDLEEAVGAVYGRVMHADFRRVLESSLRVVRVLRAMRSRLTLAEDRLAVALAELAAIRDRIRELAP